MDECIRLPLGRCKTGPLDTSWTMRPRIPVNTFGARETPKALVRYEGLMNTGLQDFVKSSHSVDSVQYTILMELCYSAQLLIPRWHVALPVARENFMPSFAARETWHKQHLCRRSIPRESLLQCRLRRRGLPPETLYHLYSKLVVRESKAKKLIGIATGHVCQFSSRE
jgi:hypothetical protein